MNKTQTGHFEWFKRSCEDFRDAWGLYGWELYFTHERIEDGHLSEVDVCMPARSATITLNTEWPDHVPITGDMLYSIAKHEMVHVLVAPIEQRMNADRYLSDDEIDEYGHEVVQRLIRLIKD